jgi:hypothetical protein
MNQQDFDIRLQQLFDDYERLVTRPNEPEDRTNGVVQHGSSDTRCHVATTTVDRLVDYCQNTPRDPLRTAACVQQRIALIEKNLIKPRPGL